MGDIGFLAAGYALTALSLGGYVASLLLRARRARARAEAIARSRAPQRVAPR